MNQSLRYNLIRDFWGGICLTLKEQIGQRLVAGFFGTSLSDDIKRIITEHKVANIILFSRNIESAEQLKNLCDEIQALVKRETGHGAFISIDQEGGIVTRLTGDCVNIPGTMALASSNDERNAYRAGYITGRELRHLGINFNLAPCADVNSNPKNPVIGVRSFGDDPEQVGRFASAMAKGFQDGGAIACLKHFPGHGDTDTDSHLSLPMVDKSREELEKCELLPFRTAIKAGAKAIMTAHILFPQIEPDRVPATMSRKIMTDLLSRDMGFEGVIMSDDMEMNAIKEFYGRKEGVIATAHAGVDLILICHDPKFCGEMADELECAVMDGRLSAEEMRESAERVINLKKEWADGEYDTEFDFCEAERETLILLERTLTAVNEEAGFVLGDNPLCIGCEAYRTNCAQNEDPSGGNLFGKVMAKMLGGKALKASQNPDESEIEEIARRAKCHSSAVVGTYNGHVMRGQVELVNALSRAGIKTAAVCLQNPYDVGLIDKNVLCIAAYEYTARSVGAAARMLMGEIKSSGKLPVKI